jgi:hypothetical protein
VKLGGENKMNNVEKHEQICKQLNKLYEQKNNAYGDSFQKTFDELGIISAVTRIRDKYNRLQTLSLNKNINTGDESIKDTLLDLANYAIMTYMALEPKSLTPTNQYNTPKGITNATGNNSHIETYLS